MNQKEKEIYNKTLEEEKKKHQEAADKKRLEQIVEKAKYDALPMIEKIKKAGEKLQEGMKKIKVEPPKKWQPSMKQ